MRIGIYASAGRGAQLGALLDRFARIDEAGFHTAWLGQMHEFDALAALALAGRVTRRCELGSWVVPLQTRHPIALAQLAATAQAACGGRLLLGVGVSHAAVIEKRLGLAYAGPLRLAEESLAVLAPLLRGERVDHDGARYRIHAALDVGAAPPALLLAALGPQMLALAGRAADGAAIWLGGARYLQELAIPAVLSNARDAGRPAPRVVCGLPIAIADRRRAADSLTRWIGPTAKLPSYRNVLARGGAASVADVALLGDDASVLDALDELAVLGVTDFNAVTFPVEGDPDAQSRTFELLGRLARLSGDR